MFLYRVHIALSQTLYSHNYISNLRGRDLMLRHNSRIFSALMLVRSSNSNCKMISSLGLAMVDNSNRVIKDFLRFQILEAVRVLKAPLRLKTVLIGSSKAQMLNQHYQYNPKHRLQQTFLISILSQFLSNSPKNLQISYPNLTLAEQVLRFLNKIQLNSQVLS